MINEHPVVFDEDGKAIFARSLYASELDMEKAAHLYYRAQCEELKVKLARLCCSNCGATECGNNK